MKQHTITQPFLFGSTEDTITLSGAGCTCTIFTMKSGCTLFMRILQDRQEGYVSYLIGTAQEIVDSIDLEITGCNNWDQLRAWGMGELIDK